MRTHPLNVSYLVVGLVFLGFAASWGLRESGIVDLGEAEWLLPATLVVAGAIGLVAFAAKRVSARDRSVADRSRGGDDGTYPEGDNR